MAATLLSSPPDAGREAMESLAASCAHRRLVHALVLTDLNRWHLMVEEEREIALIRARRRVDAVCPHPTFDFGA